MENDLISRSALLVEIRKGTIIPDDLYGMGIMAGVDAMKKKVENAPAVDAVPVVCCKDCRYGVWDEYEWLYQCVEGAEYDPEFDIYNGFVAYEEADFFCKRGERRADDE